MNFWMLVIFMKCVHSTAITRVIIIIIAMVLITKTIKQHQKHGMLTVCQVLSIISLMYLIHLKALWDRNIILSILWTSVVQKSLGYLPKFTQPEWVKAVFHRSKDRCTRRESSNHKRRESKQYGSVASVWEMKSLETNMQSVE